MAAATFIIRRHDTLPALVVQLVNPDGSLPNLVGATVLFKMSDPNTLALLVNAGATITDPVNALVTYSWSPSDTATAGTYPSEFQVTFANGSIATFPNKDYLAILVTPDL